MSEYFLKIFKHDKWQEEVGHFPFDHEETFHPWDKAQNDVLSSFKYHIPTGWELWVHKHRSPTSSHQAWIGDGEETHIDKGELEKFIHDEASGHSWVKVNGILQTFEKMRENQAVPFNITNNNGLSFPRISGSKHQQSIQKTNNGEFVITGSANEIGYFYLTDSAHNIIQVITPEHEGKDYNHLGGCQVADNILAVGYERLSAGKKGTSAILFYNIADVNNPQALSHLTINRNDENSTAGAVALMKCAGHWLLIVANWGAARLDFYRSTESDLTKVDADFGSPFASWQADNRDDQVHGWGGYQNINLFSYISSDDIFMIGMHTHSYISNEDWADLYQITLTGNNVSLVKKRNKHFIRANEGPRFRHGSGCFFDADAKLFQMYSCERNLDSNTQHNRCNKWQ